MQFLRVFTLTLLLPSLAHAGALDNAAAVRAYYEWVN